MRETLWLPCLLAVATFGCASQRDTGAALVGAGAVAVVVGASAASSTYCGSFGCYQHRPRPGGSALAVAGAAVAGAGYALAATAPRGDAQRRVSALPPASAGDAWRLRRKDPPPEPAPEPAEED